MRRRDQTECPEIQIGHEDVDLGAFEVLLRSRGTKARFVPASTAPPVESVGIGRGACKHPLNPYPAPGPFSVAGFAACPGALFFIRVFCTLS